MQPLVRQELAIYNVESSPLMPWRLLPALAIAALIDLGVATFFVFVGPAMSRPV